MPRRRRPLPEVKESPDELKLLIDKQPDEHRKSKLRYIRAIASGRALNCAHACRLAGCSEKTGRGWARTYEAGGLGALLRKVARGQPPSLSEECLEWAGRVLDGPEGCPRSWGEMRAWAVGKFGITLTLSGFKAAVLRRYPGTSWKTARPSHPRKPKDGPAALKKN